ncbi:discoidin domain-containing protein [Lentzea sp. NPDC051208]|uniref:discoidin domain-containing protein n=1 Tax=Lentzea sp. NPDC051208 TaxID=3154642 RepID=UPI00343388CC
MARVRSICTVVAVLLGFAVVPAQAAPTLLSQGKPALASSTENSGTPASAAVDGNGDTRWSSEWSAPQWLRVDFGASATLSRVELDWEGAYATVFEIQVSADGDACSRSVR